MVVSSDRNLAFFNCVVCSLNQKRGMKIVVLKSVFLIPFPWFCRHLFVIRLRTSWWRATVNAVAKSDMLLILLSSKSFMSVLLLPSMSLFWDILQLLSSFSLGWCVCVVCVKESLRETHGVSPCVLFLEATDLDDDLDQLPRLPFEHILSFLVLLRASFSFFWFWTADYCLPCILGDLKVISCEE